MDWRLDKEDGALLNREQKRELLKSNRSLVQICPTCKKKTIVKSDSEGNCFCIMNGCNLGRMTEVKL